MQNIVDLYFLCTIYIIVHTVYYRIVWTMSIQKIKVCIIGAGAAGLAATNKLINEGIKDVILIEAQDRIGGRIHSKDHGMLISHLLILLYYLKVIMQCILNCS